jgi:hypothetical protein
MNIQEFPQEILIEIFKNIPLLDLIRNCSLVDSFFHKISLDKLVVNNQLDTLFLEVLKLTDTNIDTTFWFNRKSKKFNFPKNSLKLHNIINDISLVACHPTIFFDQKYCHDNLEMKYLKLSTLSNVNFTIYFINKNFVGTIDEFKISTPFIISNTFMLQDLFELLIELTHDLIDTQYADRMKAHLKTFIFNNTVYKHFNFGNEVVKLENNCNYTIYYKYKTTLLLL